MSSILEALEKSEKERNQDSIPRYHSMQPPAESKGLLNQILWAILVLALLSGLYFLINHFQVVDKVKSAFASKPEVIETAKVNAADTVNNTPEEPVVNKLTGLAKVAQPEAETLAYSELSDDEKSLLPSERINVVSVSEDKARSFVMLGDKMYREGNTLGQGAVLKGIAKDHILIEYNGRLVKRLLD